MSKPSRKKRREKKLGKKLPQFFETPDIPAADTSLPTEKPAQISTKKNVALKKAANTPIDVIAIFQKHDVSFTLLLGALVIASFAAILYFDSQTAFLTELGSWLANTGNIQI